MSKSLDENVGAGLCGRGDSWRPCVMRPHRHSANCHHSRNLLSNDCTDPVGVDFRSHHSSSTHRPSHHPHHTQSSTMSATTTRNVMGTNQRHIRRSIVLYAIALLCLQCCTASAAAPSNASSSSSSSSGSGQSHSLADDVCSQPMLSDGCLVSVSCASCLMRPGCAIESTTGNCVSLKRINTANVGIEYFLSGKTQYCDASDAACSACTTANAAANAVCRGSSGCVCVRRCEIAPQQVFRCESSSFKDVYALLGAALIIPVIVIARSYRGLGRNLRTTFERQFGRSADASSRPSNPLTMKLDGWRNFIANEHPERIDHKLCPMRLSDEMSSMEEGRMTEDCNAVSPMGTSAPTEGEYVMVSSPTNARATHTHQ